MDYISFPIPMIIIGLLILIFTLLLGILFSRDKETDSNKEKKIQDTDKKYKNIFEKPPYVDILRWTENGIVSEKAGCNIYAKQILTLRNDKKVYPANFNEVPIGVALYSCNKNDTVAIAISGTVVYIFAGEDIKRGESIRAGRVGNWNGFGFKLKNNLKMIAGIALEDIPKKKFGMIYLTCMGIPTAVSKLR